MTAAVIVQARMTSTRLPGKVLLPLDGTTVLEHVLTRCLAIANADVVCCAIPEGPAHEPLIEIIEYAGAVVYQGSESDVLDRHYQAARKVGADIVLRVTSDCPMTDPEICARVLELVRGGGADFACNNMPPSWPHGLDCEAVSFKWLERAALEAEKQFEREHVMPWIRGHPDVIKANLVGPGGGTEANRWTIDDPDDYAFLEAMWKRLPAGPAGWPYMVALAIVEREPALAAINAGHDRLEGLKKSMREEKP